MGISARQGLAALALGLAAAGYGAVTLLPSPSTGQTVDAPAITAEAVAAALAARRETLETALAEAAPEARGPILAELAAVRRGLADPRAALAAAEGLRGKLAAAADLYAGTPAADALAAAAAAQAGGDPAAAQAALQDALVLADAEISRAARLADLAGNLAAERGDTVRAAVLFGRAAALEASYSNLLAAETWARQAGDVATAGSYAVPLLRAAVGSFGQGSAQHGAALAAIAQTYVAAGRAAEAEPLLRESIAIAEGPRGARDAEYAMRLNNLGIILRLQNRNAEAEQLMRKAIEVDREVLGERHPDVAARLANLADLLAATGRAPEAEGVYRQAAEIARQTLGADDPETAARLLALAGFLQATGSDPRATLAEAEASVRAAFAGQPALAGQLSALGGALNAAGDADAAERLYREALDLIATAPGRTSPDYGRALNNLGLLLAANGRADEADAAYREALAVLTASVGSEAAETRTVAANLDALTP